MSQAKFNASTILPVSAASWISPTADTLCRQEFDIQRSQRERLNGHGAKVVWFTGLSGAGKSTLANALELALHMQGMHTYILDGDHVRHGLNQDLGFSHAERQENIRRVAEVAKLMMDAGMIVLVAVISPFHADRALAKSLIGEQDFIEVFVDTPLSVCQQRDSKGLYQRARNGQLMHMTGIDSPYEIPTQPHCVLTHGEYHLEQAINQLVKLIQD